MVNSMESNEKINTQTNGTPVQYPPTNGYVPPGIRNGNSHVAEKPSSRETTDEEEKPKKAKQVKSQIPAYKVKLERVLGLTVPCNAALDCDPTTGVVAYPAGCTVVLLNARRNRQTHVQNACRKAVTCVTFSSCGRYLATGECGHAPSVRVWDLQEKTQVGEFSGHKYGVSCVAFSPAQKYVVSVGSQHDMIVNVWDWRAGAKVASNKFSSKVKAISFAENGSYFVTVGNRHVKFWYLDVARGSKFKEPVPLTGRSAILGEQRNNYFCDVACGRGEMGDSTFAITKSGLLCEFNNRRLLDKWVELRTPCANCLVAGEDYLFVGCAEGIIRCFNPFNLQFITTLPRTHYLGVDVSKGLSISHMASHPNNAKYPDTIAITLDEINHKVTAVYNDHSLYVWDVKDIKRVGKSHSYLYHSACIWGVEIYPKNTSRSGKKLFPDGSFITCSSDDTMRIWNFDPEMPSDTSLKRNIYSQELLKNIYVDPEMTFIKDTDVSPQGADKGDGSYDSRNGVRCIKVSYDGKHLASGDRAGNIRIHELEYMDEVCKIEAHDAEVLCLEYTRPETGHNFLSSASRDRLIHVFNVRQDYSFLQTLDDHSSAITSVRFYQSQGNLQMVSCGADRSIIFRSATQNPQNEVFFSRGHNVAGKTTLYDMEVDHGQRHILTACQDRNIRVYNVNSGKHSKTFKGSVGDDGTLIKVVLDQSGLYAATSCTDKSMCIYDYYSGECMATMYGHSEIVTGLKFTNDGKYLITVSGDGCIFIWSLPRDMTQVIVARLAQQAERTVKEQRKLSQNSQPLDNEVFRPSPERMYNSNANIEIEEPDYRFNVGQLPLWAKKQINETKPNGEGANNNVGLGLDMPKGRWAQRLPNNPVTFKSHYDTDSTVPYPAIDKRIDSESSKESSLEDNVLKKIPPQPPPRRNSIKQNHDNQNDYIGLSSPESSREIGLGEDAFQGTPGKSSSKRRGDPDRLRMRLQNLHQHTDDSDVSSLRVDDPATTTDHDGDIEDYCDHDDESSTGPGHSEHLMYYPANEETTADFTVNAMDVEELRRSQRRHRKTRPERPTDIPLMSISGSQESDEEDEVSTPSADTAERNILSMLSVSTESVDRVGRREIFLKNNFESLEGDSSRLSKDAKNKNSISYKFNARNRETINTSKRQELLKRIEETRKKLQCIGYKSTLRSSKSISDLCNIPEKDSSYLGSNHQGNDFDNNQGSPFVLPLPPVLASHFPSNLSSPLTSLKHLLLSGTSSYDINNYTINDSSLDIGGALFEDNLVSSENKNTGRELLLQFEKDLKTIEKLLYGALMPSPLEAEADSLEETLRNMKFDSQELIDQVLKEDSETDTMKSEESNFSCDSLDDYFDFDDDEGEVPSTVTNGNPDVNERREARDRGLLRLSRLNSTSSLPSMKKRLRWDNESLKSEMSNNKSDFELDSIDPAQECEINNHRKIIKTQSDSTHIISDIIYTDAETPTNPPFFTVKTPTEPNLPKLPSSLFESSMLFTDPCLRSSDPNLTSNSMASYMQRHKFFLQRLFTENGQPQWKNHTPSIRNATLGMHGYPVIQAQPLPPGPPPTAYLGLSQIGIGAHAPGKAQRVSLARRVTLSQVLPSKRKNFCTLKAWAMCMVLFVTSDHFKQLFRLL